jgi:CRISPR-associated endonuclease/helicase Cas3
VAELASRFAAAFDSAEWGHLAGLWHDLGKYRPEFQRRIRGSREQAPHAGAGAVHAMGVGPPLAFVIAGHHAGLANFAAKLSTAQIPLQQRITEERPSLETIRATVPRELLEQPRPALPAWLDTRRGASAERIEFWTRFLFSALVDADRLATEAFYEPAKRSAARDFDSVAPLRRRLDARLDQFTSRAPIDALRRQVLADCRAAAEWSPGLFSLSVPTGGGKTLSSMAFALRHAERHGLRRVIVVIPFTSIIEQNAAVYREVLGERNVIEHHSAVDETARRKSDGELEVRRRLAAENWDAPVVVTTSVQFFESLFSNEPSRCRKLHNIANSVVVVDEAQTLPTDFLLCLLDAMRELTAHYGCSLVLSTATQPALRRRAALPQGLDNVREIVGDTDALGRALRRIDVRWPVAGVTTPFQELAREVVAQHQVLAVVHQRRDARTLAELLPDAGRHHLSTRMCAAHRMAVLHDVRSALKAGAVCRVVSTQLVEAGVDVDFPVVYRAMAGLDSLAQAAGRCNRHGMLTDDEGRPALGRFVVFRAETQPPPGVLRRGLEVAEGMLTSRGPDLDMTDGDVLDEYFRHLYHASQLDRRGVSPHRASFNFATVAQLVRFIDEGMMHPVLVPWSDAAERVARFATWPSRESARALQPFVVQVREFELHALQRMGAVAPLEGFGYVLSAPYLHLYHPHFGLTIDEDAAASVDALIQ